jgi:hypothetical protein
METYNSNISSNFNTPNNFLFYSACGVLIILSIIAWNNENLFFSQKVDQYQVDNIQVYKDILNNTSTEKIAFIFSQLQTILLNQSKIMQKLDLNQSASFVLDPSVIEFAEELALSYVR